MRLKDKGPIVDINSATWQQTVIAGARALGVEISADQARSMVRHAREMLLWNQVTNLTAITDPLEVAVKHYVDALAVAIRIDAGIRVMDAGSGGGFPGLPLKIVRPDLAVTLVDSVRKKVTFLKFIIGTLGLNGVHAVHGRLEDLGRLPAYCGKFDLVVCRAFASLEAFVKLSRPFLSPGGSLLAMKGPQAEHEHESGIDNGRIVLAGIPLAIHIHRYRLPLLGDRRRLVRLTPI